VDPSHATQIHDYNPGITGSGLFWTIAIPDEAVHAEFNEAKAEFKLSDLAIPDYGSIPNGLFHLAPPLPGKVSFEIRWSGATSHGTFTDAGKRFTMNFVQTGAHISWHGRTGPDSFHTTDGAQTTVFAQIARQRSGAFFDDED